MTTHRQPTRRSAVMILALLLVGTITASTIALSIVIADSTHQTTTLNDFITASLMADSGVERGLAVVKAGRQELTIANTLTAITPTSQPGMRTCPDKPTCVTLTGANSGGGDTFRWQTLKPRESVTFDILDYDDSGNLQSPSTDQITVSGALNAVRSTLGQGALDVSWVGLNANGVPFYSGRYFVGRNQVEPGITINLRNLIDTSATSPVSVVPGLLRGFRVRVTAMDRPDIGGFTAAENITVDTVSNLLIIGSSSSTGASTGFPSRISISSTGQTNNSQSLKTATVLWQPPTSGIFNYVLFTEGDIKPE